MPTSNVTPKLLKADSVSLFNAIVGKSSVAYQNRIPKVTQGTLSYYMEKIQSYAPDWNIFCNDLMNGPLLDLFINSMWANPLAPLKKGSVMSSGSWIREIAWPLIMGQDYDPDATDVFSSRPPEIEAAYHVQNRKAKYKVSINRDALNQALFADPTGGLASFINGIVGQQYKADTLDEYLCMRKAITNFDDKYTIWNINAVDITTAVAGDKEAAGKDLLQKMRQTAMEMQLTHPEYTGSGIFNPVANTGDLILLATPAVLSNVDVNVLAGAFNLNKADNSYLGRIIPIDPLTRADGSNIQAILCDQNFLVAADTLVTSAEIQNPETLTHNNWLHHWEIISASPFANVVAFSSSPTSTETIDLGAITSVTLEVTDGSAATVPQGTGIQLTATVVGTGNFSDAVEWKLTADSGKINSADTWIDQSGIVWVGDDEENTSLTVTTTSLQDPTKSATLDVAVIPKV